MGMVEMDGSEELSGHGDTMGGSGELDDCCHQYLKDNNVALRLG